MDIENKVIFISGSTRGIGRELAAECLRLGARVIMHGRSNEHVRAAVKALTKISKRVDGVAADITNGSQIEQMMKYLHSIYKKIDVFVHNAGVSMRGDFASCSSALFTTLIATNLTATLLITREMLPLLRDRGTIAFISSGAALYGFPHVIPYSVTKMALTALQQGLSIELHERKIHVSTVYLDFVENDSEKTILDARNHAIRIKRKARLTQKQAADAIISTIRHHHRIHYVGSGTKMIAFLARYFPHLLHALLMIKNGAIHSYHSHAR